MSENAISTQVTPLALVQAAIDKGASIEQMQQLFELQLKWEANEARKAFNEAMARFKSKNIKIIKKSLVDFQTGKGRTSYKHAKLGDVLEQIIDAMSQEGLSNSWKTSQNGNQITVTCRISHIQGHYEENSISAEPDTSGTKNSIQAIGSTITYLERYTLKAALGLAEHDDDANKGDTPETITEDQAEDLDALAADVGADLEKFLSFMRVETLMDIPKKQYAAAVKALESKRGQK